MPDLTVTGEHTHVLHLSDSAIIEIRQALRERQRWLSRKELHRDVDRLVSARFEVDLQLAQDRLIHVLPW